MSNLFAEIGLRLAKALAAGIVGLILYAVLVGPAGHPGSIELALLCWLSGGAFVLLSETSPI